MNVLKILIVLTSHSQLGDTGHKTGFWVEEFAAPYYALADAGVELTIASPLGGQPPIDPKSEAPESQTEATRRFYGDKALRQKLANSVPLSQVNPADYDAVFYPGATARCGTSPTTKPPSRSSSSSITTASP